MTDRMRKVRRLRRERNKKSIKLATVAFIIIAAAIFLLMAIVQGEI